MKNIGVLVAVEIQAVLDRYGDRLVSRKVSGFMVHSLEEGDYRVHFLHSGVGLIRAAAAIQMLCDRFSIDFLINFGIVGALVEGLEVGQTCLVSKVVHYQMDGSQFDNSPVGKYASRDSIYLETSQDILARAQGLFPQCPIVIGASGDKFVGTREDKVSLHRDFGAHICDMEAASVVLVCELNQVPHLIIKTVSDSLEGGAGECIARARDTAQICMDFVERLLGERFI